MIKSRLQIGDGPIEDTFEKWGFIYMDADERTEAPIKGRASTSYAEEAGEHLDPRTVQDAFDYTIKYLIECPNKNLVNANSKIAAFNKALYTKSGDIRTYKEVTVYNDFNRVRIVGYPEPIAVPTEFYRRLDGSVMDCAVVELKLRVSNPTRCEFDMRTGGGSMIVPTMQIQLDTDGEDLFVTTSRPLEADEHPVLLRHGAARTYASRSTKPVLRRNHWQVYYSYYNDLEGVTVRWPFELDKAGMFKYRDEFGRLSLPVRWWPVLDKKYPLVYIQKAQSSKFIIPALEGRTAKICYGVAVYKDVSLLENKIQRVSNVAFFRSNVRILRVPEKDIDYEAIEQWLSI